MPIIVLYPKLVNSRMENLGDPSYFNLARVILLQELRRTSEKKILFPKKISVVVAFCILFVERHFKSTVVLFQH